MAKQRRSTKPKEIPFTPLSELIDEKIYNAEGFAGFAQVPVSTIRYWEQIGKIKGNHRSRRIGYLGSYIRTKLREWGLK